MTDNQSNNTRAAKNTMMLYFRMVFLMIVSLYTSRVVLSTLGVDDYGIFNVVGGFVSFFGFLNGALSGGTNRFITYALGSDDREKLNKTFSTCFVSHLVIAAIIFILAETVGLWFVLEKLSIPEDRTVAAMWVYQCSILSSIVMVISVPYNADIIAHEKMSAFALISIIEAFLKLGIVFLLRIGKADKLVLYAILSLAVSILIRSLYSSYCHKKFEESRYVRIVDKDLFKEIFSFSGWNLWGNLAFVLMTQGVNVLLNVFFGTAVNAARALAVQVQGAVQQFATNFQMAINPQITKYYAANDIGQMHNLVCRSAKFTFFLMQCISLPILLETPVLMSLWLEQVPDYTVVFVRLVICITVIEATANPLITAANSTGKVKKYQIIVGGILLMIVPISYVILKVSPNPIWVFIIHFCIAICAYIARLFLLRSMINFPIKLYVKKVLLPIITVAPISTLCSYMVSLLISDSILGSFLNIAQSIIISVIVCFVFGLTSSEKSFIVSKIHFKKKNDYNL